MTSTSHSMSVTRSTLLALTVSVTFLRAVAPSAQVVPAFDHSVAIGNQAADEARMPSNFVLTPILAPVVETMWHQSPTFNAQCARLRQAPSLLVELRFGNASQVGAGRGRANFVRSSRDSTRAEIYIDPKLRSVAELVELIAYELEHVIEQLDDVELTADTRHGVHLTAGGSFETVRAGHIGQKVSREVMAATTSFGVGQVRSPR